jgi:GNAT superfamily N-acetyltransferase
MTNREMLDVVRRQLATDLNCSVNDLSGTKDSLVFVEAKDNPGRTPYRRGPQHFDMLTMGSSIVVSATPARLEYAKEQLAGKGRDDAFTMPFIRGHSIWYLPDLDSLKPLSAPEGFAYETVETDDVPRLREVKGFNNALQYDVSHPIQNVLVKIAKRGSSIAAMAGAVVYSAKTWAIGIDVLPEYRSRGLAAYMVNALAIDVLNRGIVPCFGTTSSNLASQRVAHRAGFMPAWMCDHRVRFEGELR